MFDPFEEDIREKFYYIIFNARKDIVKNKLDEFFKEVVELRSGKKLNEIEKEEGIKDIYLEIMSSILGEHE